MAGIRTTGSVSRVKHFIHSTTVPKGRVLTMKSPLTDPNWPPACPQSWSCRLCRPSYPTRPSSVRTDQRSRIRHRTTRPRWPRPPHSLRRPRLTGTSPIPTLKFISSKLDQSSVGSVRAEILSCRGFDSRRTQNCFKE